MEQETSYRWDAEERVIWGWTANPSEARRWRALGYLVTEQPGGWKTQVPVEALALLPMKAGTVQVSRYLDPPVVIKAPRPRDGRSDVQISEQIRASEAGAPHTTGHPWSGSGEAA
jgi:hypothetical protein